MTAWLTPETKAEVREVWRIGPRVSPTPFMAMAMVLVSIEILWRAWRRA